MVTVEFFCTKAPVAGLVIATVGGVVSTGGQTPQSPGHVLHVSVPVHVASPQIGGGGGQTPQSPGQVLHVSVPLQVRSPQNTGGGGPLKLVPSAPLTFPTKKVLGFPSPPATVTSPDESSATAAAPLPKVLAHIWAPVAPESLTASALPSVPAAMTSFDPFTTTAVALSPSPLPPLLNS